MKKVKGNKYKITGKKKGKTVITVMLKSGKKAKCTVAVKKGQKQDEEKKRMIRNPHNI